MFCLLAKTQSTKSVNELRATGVHKVGETFISRPSRNKIIMMHNVLSDTATILPARLVVLFVLLCACVLFLPTAVLPEAFITSVTQHATKHIELTTSVAQLSVVSKRSPCWKGEER